MDNFGEWVNNITDINKTFINNKPFPHIIIDNFLSESFIEKINLEFPTNYDNWHKYNNPLEVKYTYDSIDKLNNCDNIKLLFKLLSSSQDIFSKISNIPLLESDPTFHGSGLHVQPRDGRLSIHLDYEKHPILNNKQRRLNLILYISKDWNKEWNGATELWDNQKCIVQSDVKFNSAILFQTSDISWHGVPKKIKCPENIFRKTIAYYYLSPIVASDSQDKIGNDGSGYRTKATYINVENDPRIDEFLKIRPFRRIELEDIQKHWPEWNSKEN